MPSDSTSDSFKRLFKRQEETSNPEQTEQKSNPSEVKGVPPRRIVRIESNKPNSQQDEFSNISVDIKSTQSEIQKKEELLKKADHDISPLQEKHQAASNCQQDLESRIVEQQNLLQKLLEEQKVFSQRIHVNLSEKDSLMVSIKNLTEIIIPQQSQQVKKIENEIRQAQIEAQRRQGILANLLQEIPKQKASLESLQTKDAELKNTYQEAKNRWGQLTETLWQLEREINQKAAELQRVKGSILQSDNTVAQYGQLLDRTDKSIQMTEAETAKRQQELAFLSKGYSSVELNIPARQRPDFDSKTNTLKIIFRVLFGLVVIGLVGVTIWQVIVRVVQKN